MSSDKVLPDTDPRDPLDTDSQRLDDDRSVARARTRSAPTGLILNMEADPEAILRTAGAEHRRDQPSLDRPSTRPYGTMSRHPPRRSNVEVSTATVTAMVAAVLSKMVEAQLEKSLPALFEAFMDITVKPFLVDRVRAALEPFTHDVATALGDSVPFVHNLRNALEAYRPPAEGEEFLDEPRPSLPTRVLPEPSTDLDIPPAPPERRSDYGPVFPEKHTTARPDPVERNIRPEDRAGRTKPTGTRADYAPFGFKTEQDLLDYLQRGLRNRTGRQDGTSRGLRNHADPEDSSPAPRRARRKDRELSNYRRGYGSPDPGDPSSSDDSEPRRGRKKSKKFRKRRSHTHSATSSSESSSSEDDRHGRRHKHRSGKPDARSRKEAQPTDQLPRGDTALVPFRPLNDLFTKALDFNTYRLLKTSTRYTSDTAARITKLRKKLDIQMKNNSFSGSDPIALFSFLDRFKSANFRQTSSMSEAAFADHLWDRVLRCGTVFSDRRLKATYAEGLLPSTCAQVRNHLASNPLLYFRAVARYAQALGSTTRASRRPANANSVQFARPTGERKKSPVLSVDSTDHSGHPSTDVPEEDSAVLLMGPHTGNGQTATGTSLAMSSPPNSFYPSRGISTAGSPAPSTRAGPRTAAGPPGNIYRANNPGSFASRQPPRCRLCLNPYHEACQWVTNGIERAKLLAERDANYRALRAQNPRPQLPHPLQMPPTIPGAPVHMVLARPPDSPQEGSPLAPLTDA